MRVCDGCNVPLDSGHGFDRQISTDRQYSITMRGEAPGCVPIPEYFEAFDMCLPCLKNVKSKLAHFFDEFRKKGRLSQFND